MFIFLINLVIHIFLHEGGHLIAAKLCKCGVDIFSIGFGKAILKKKLGKTTYQIAPILLGGYCKLKGELNYSRSKYAFTNLPYRKKLFITYAGILVNCLIGIIALFVGKLLMNVYVMYFGVIGLLLGITNALPIPALDGSYPFLVLLEKKYGKKKGYKLMEKICNIGFIFLMFLNVITIILLFIFKNQIIWTI